MSKVEKELETLEVVAVNIGATHIEGQMMQCGQDYGMHISFTDDMRDLVPFHPYSNNGDVLEMLVRAPLLAPDINHIILSAWQAYQNHDDRMSHIRKSVISHFRNPFLGLPHPKDNSIVKESLYGEMKDLNLNAESIFFLGSEHIDSINPQLIELFRTGDPANTYLADDFMVNQTNWLKHFQGHSVLKKDGNTLDAELVLQEIIGSGLNTYPTHNFIVNFKLPVAKEFEFNEQTGELLGYVTCSNQFRTKLFLAPSFEIAVFYAIRWAKQQIQLDMKLARTQDNSN